MNLSLQLNQKQLLRQHIDPALIKHWNDKLQQPFALAPADWLEQGLVTKDVFDHQNKHYGRMVTEYMLEELQFMKDEIDGDRLPHEARLPLGMFTVNGIGTFRDIEGWVPAFNEEGLRGMFNEVADKPAKRAKRILSTMEAQKKNPKFNIVRRIELKGENFEIDTGTLLLFESAFKQVLPKERMEAIGRRQGEYLRWSHSISRRIVEVHSFAKDNPADLLWGNAITEDLKRLLPPDFPYHNRGVLWGDTTPYSLWELLEPIEDGLRRRVKVVRKRKLRYYHQTYTMLTIVAG